MDGDGRDDLLVATLYAGSGGGGAYLVPGPITGTQDLDTAGHRVESDSASHGAGRSIGMADTDGDGLEDLIIGSAWADPPGARILLGPVSADRHLADADAFLWGGSSSYAGHGSDLGDVDGDGLADALVRAYCTTGGGSSVYVSYGPVNADVSLTADADATLGDTLGGGVGRVVRGGRDVDGDGIGDIVVPAPYADYGGPFTGVVYVVYGPVYGTFNLAAADGILVGETPNAFTGVTLAMGDCDGDGLSDVVVGATGVYMPAMDAGAAYVVHGPASGAVDLGAADLVVRGSAANEWLGSGVAAYDIDGDGAEEVLIGAFGQATAGGRAGAAFLFFGPRSGTLADTDADATFFGEGRGDEAGEGVAMGDLDGDGLGEVIVGAKGDDTGGIGAGAVFVVYPE